MTAAHVIRGLEEDRGTGGVVACQLGHDLTLDLTGKHQMIDRHDGMAG